jgi:hypothetical protein
MTATIDASDRFVPQYAHATWRITYFFFSTNSHSTRPVAFG